jgi:Helix-turn-helix domain
VLDTDSLAKSLPDSREEKSADARNVGGAKDAALEQLLNIDEAARIIGRAHWTLRRDIRCRKLKCIRIGRRIMIEPSEIRRLIEQGREGGP